MLYVAGILNDLEELSVMSVVAEVKESVSDPVVGRLLVVAWQEALPVAPVAGPLPGTYFLNAHIPIVTG